MDSNDIMDDKDSGPEVQINFPSSVMSRIEELMGGTDQFDSDEVSSPIHLFSTYSSSRGGGEDWLRHFRSLTGCCSYVKSKSSYKFNK